jgi:signal transduction histidine kinase
VTKSKYFILFLLINSLCTITRAQQSFVTVTDASKPTLISNEISILKHPNLKSLTIEDVFRLDSLFKPNQTGVTSTGVDKLLDVESWWKLEVDNKTDEMLFMSVEPALLDSFEVFKKLPNGWDVQRTGKLVAIEPTNLSSPNHLVELKVKASEKQVFYIHVKAILYARAKILIAGKNYLTVEGQRNSLINGAILGVVVLISFLSFWFYYLNEQTVYLWFAVFILTMTVVAVYFVGYWQTIFFPNNYWLNYYSPLLINFPSAFAIFMSIYFIKSENFSPTLEKILYLTFLFLIVNIFAGIFFSIGLSVLVIYVIMPIFILITIAAAFKSYKQGNESSKYYIAGFTLFGIYLGGYLFEDTGIVPQFTLSSSVFIYALGMQAFMLLLAMIRHLHDFKKAKEEADKKLITSLEAQRMMMSKHNVMLEKEVNERTSALTKTLSELEQKEEELKLYADKLKKSNGELLDFASIISHDLKAPLRNTTSFLQLLLRRNKDKFDDTDNEYVKYIVESSAQSVRLVDDLLNYSKLDKNIGEPEKIDLTEIIANTCVTLRAIMETRQASIVLEKIPDVQAHRSLIVMLMQNLINNGIKYNDKQSPEIKIGYFKNIKGEDVFYVQDNGIGIAAKYQEEVFKMFRRLHTKDTYEGTGIGLAFVKRIINYYKGRIWFESTEGAGTTFFFTLPEATNVQLQSSDLVGVE